MSGILRANSPVSLMDPLLLKSMEYLSVNFLDMFLVLNFLPKFWRFDDPLSQKWIHKSRLVNLALEVLGNRAKGELNTTKGSPMYYEKSRCKHFCIKIKINNNLCIFSY